MTSASPDPVAPARALPLGLPRGARLDEAAFAARHRVLWPLLHAHLPVLAAVGVARDTGGVLLWGQLAEAVLLAHGWRFTEEADRRRRQEQQRTAAVQAEQVQAQTALAQERARSAQDAAEQLQARQQHLDLLAARIGVVQGAGGRLTEQVATIGEVVRGLRAEVSGIAGVAEAQSTISAAVGQQSASTEQAQTAVAVASLEAEQMAHDLDDLLRVP